MVPILILVVMVAIFGISYSDGTAQAAYSSTDGEFVISSTEELVEFWTFAVGGNYSFIGKTVRLVADVDGGALPSIGRISGFGGVFLGNGHRINNLKSHLFDTLISGSTVSDLVLGEVDTYTSALAVTNHGTVRDVYVSGSIKGDNAIYVGGVVVTNGSDGVMDGVTNVASFSTNRTEGYISGIADANYGIIRDSFFGGKISVDRNVTYTVGMAGISYRNKGSIESCTVATEYENGAEHVNEDLTVVGIASGEGNVSSSFALVSHNFPIGTAVDIASGTVSGVEGIVSNGTASYYGTVSGAITTVDETTLSMVSGIEYVGSGTSVDPYIVDGIADLQRIKYSSVVAENVYYELNSDINVGGEKITSLNNFTHRPGNIFGGGFALIQADTPFTFAMDGSDIGFVNSTATTLSGERGSYYYSDQGTWFEITGAETEVGGLEPDDGMGTADSPYIVTNIQELLFLDGSDFFAELGRDILVNYRSNNKLTIRSFSGKLEGNGRTIIGMSDTLFLDNDGTIANLKVRANATLVENNGGIISNVSYLCDNTVPVVWNNYGTLTRISLRGDVDCMVENNFSGGTISESNNYAVSNIAFARTNEGSITRCKNYGETELYSYQGNGTMTNCINYGGWVESINPGVDYCINAVSPYSRIVDGEEKEGVDYSSLSSDGFDFSVWGYEAGSDIPSLRRAGGSYKTEIAVLTNNFLLDYPYYVEGVSYTQTEINETIINANDGIIENTTFAWTYNGVAHAGDISDAGVYEVTASFSGNENYLPKVEKYSLTIDKAVSEVLPIFVENSFDDIEVVYSGSSVILPTPHPDNHDVLVGMGMTQKFVLTKGGEELVSAVNAGEYLYTTIYQGNNYYDISVSVAVTVSKKELTLVVRNATVKYGQSFDITSCYADIISGLIPSDIDKTVESFTSDYRDCFATDYTAGKGIGSYDITFNGVADNYYYTVTKGTLTVERIFVPTDGVSFYGATRENNGTYIVNYSGEEVVLTATVPSGITVTYGQNKFTDSGSRTVTATLSIDENYYDTVLKVDLTINKVDLTFTAPDVTVAYGQPIDYSPQVTVSGFVGGEDLVSLNITPTYGYFDGSTPIGEGYDAGEYSVKVTSELTLTNYNVIKVDGVLKIEKITLDKLKKKQGSFVDISKGYDGIAVTRKVDYFTEEEVDVVYSVTKGDAVVGEMLNAGTYTVTATVTPKGTLAVNYSVTEYVCKVNITKKVYTLSFSQEEYTVIYDGVTRGGEDFSVNGLPTGYAVEFSFKKGGEETPVLHAGEYDVRATYAGSENEETALATARITVEARPIEVTIVDVYDYSGERIIPTVTEITNAIGSEITAENIVFAYRNASGQSVIEIRNAGDYHVDMTVNNGDYRIGTPTKEVTVNRITVPFSMDSISYVYGTAGEVTIGGRGYYVGENILTARNYPVMGVNMDINLYVGKQAGRYVITDKDIMATTNYSFSVSEEIAVTVERRELSLSWLVDGFDLNGTVYDTYYIGASQNGRFRFALSNFAYGESITDVDVRMNVGGAGTDIKDVGTYTVRATIHDSNNYTLPTNGVTVNVHKVELHFSVGDTTIQQWESYNPSYQVSGRVGEDADVPAYRLKGASISVVTAYNSASPIGATYSVTVNARFHNYDAVVDREGAITVVKNDFPDYTSAEYLRNVAVPYTGEDIVATIQGIDDRVTVRYDNNVQKNAGSYTVSVTIVYPTGRTQNGTFILTIAPATPIAVAESGEKLYIEGYVLQVGDIVGKATVGGKTVAGEFVPDENQALRRGEGQYNYTFLPYDKDNYLPTVGTVTIKSDDVNFGDFTVDPIDNFTFVDNGTKVEITGAVKLTLNPVLSGLTLYRNGSQVDYVILDKTETVTVKVMLGEDTAFEQTFPVTLIKRSEGVTVDITALTADGAIIEGKKIKVGPMGGRISLKDEYKEGYVFYVNGVQREEYIVNGNEGTITVAIRTKGVGVLVYTTEMTVVLEEDTAIQQDYTLYYVIGGVAVGLVAVMAIVLIIWRKKHG